MFAKIAWVCATLFGYTGAVSCDAGYAGNITATADSPYYTGTCTPVSCPFGSNGSTVPSGCDCLPGYKGTIVALTESPFFSGHCTPEHCPDHSHGHDVVVGCVCVSGYEGIIKTVEGAPYFTGKCSPIEDEHQPEELLGECWPHSTFQATTDGWNCLCNAGYTFHINAGTNECVKIIAIDTIEHPEDHQMMEKSSPNPCGSGNISLAAITNGWACLYGAGYTGVETGGCGHAHATFLNITSGWACVCKAGYDGTLKPMQCVKITAMEYAEETSEDQQKEDEAAEDANTIMISVAVGGLLTGAVAASAFVLKRRHATGRSEPLLEK